MTKRRKEEMGPKEGLSSIGLQRLEKEVVTMLGLITCGDILYIQQELRPEDAPV
jgi:hypothetical protein